MKIRRKTLKPTVVPQSEAKGSTRYMLAPLWIPFKTRCTGDWLGPTACLDGCGRSRPYWEHAEILQKKGKKMKTMNYGSGKLFRGTTQLHYIGLSRSTKPCHLLYLKTEAQPASEA